MRFLHLSDLHIGKIVNGFSMVEDQINILEQIVKITAEQAVDAVLLSGDIYDRAAPSEEAMRIFDRFLTELAADGRPVLMISGNHDSAGRLTFGSEIFRTRQIYMSGSLADALTPVRLADAYGEVCFYLLPFTKPVHVRAAIAGADAGEMMQTVADAAQTGMQEGARTAQTDADAEQAAQTDTQEDAQMAQTVVQDAGDLHTYQQAIDYVIRQMDPDPAVRNVILAHQFVTGASRSDSETVSVGGTDNIDTSLFDAFDYAALGHIHGPQSVGRKTVRYCGTPLKYSFSEADQQKSVTIVEMKEKGNVTVETVPLTPLHDLRRIRGTYEELTLRANYIHTNTDDYLHVTLTDEEDVPDAMSRLSVIYPHIMQLSYDNRRTAKNAQIDGGADAVRTKSVPELIGEFYELQNNQAMSDTQAAYVRALTEDA